MPTSKGFRLIQGGKHSGADSPTSRPGLPSAAQLLDQAVRYRRLLGRKPQNEALALVDDMEEAIDALRRLEQGGSPEALMRAQEYRRLIAEIGAEIDAILKEF
jgi:hypothetical protein